MDRGNYTLWTGIKDAFSGLWHFLDDILLEPIVLGLAVLLFLTRIQTGIEQSANFREFFQWLGDDMLENYLPYLVFAILFLIWLVFKMIRVRNENLRNIRQNELLEIMVKTLKNMDKKLDEIRGHKNDEPSDPPDSTM